MENHYCFFVVKFADIGIKVGSGRVREDEYSYLNCENCQSLTSKLVWTYYCILLSNSDKDK